MIATPACSHHGGNAAGGKDVRTHSTKLSFLAAIAAIGYAALHAPQALAQSAQRCTTIDDDADRLACYDKALRPAPPPPRAAPPTATAVTPPAAPAAAASPPPSAPEAKSTVATENRATRREREVRESTASAPPAAPAAPAARRAPAATPAEEPGIVPIVIVQIRSLPGRPVTFVTDKGESWVQTDNERQMPAVPFKAAIKPGSMSSFFLVPEDYAHSFRVRRAK